MLDLSIDPIAEAAALASLYLQWRQYRLVEQGEEKNLSEPAGAGAMIEQGGAAIVSSPSMGRQRALERF
jgi:hypothetical protein